MTVRFAGLGNLHRRAARAGVHLSSSDIYYVDRPKSRAGTEYILGLSAISERAIREAIKRLARLHEQS
ncbi:MAG TPA: hypothetical protein VFI56_13970 [Vicinamibacterales bacterium]|nr:hypothetical protein [Vicinamibacterales bacterium]